MVPAETILYVGLSFKPYMTYSLYSSKGGYVGIILRIAIGVVKEDTRSLDFGSHIPMTFYILELSFGLDWIQYA